MDKKYWVYIATNKSHTLYTGVTNNLSKRMYEHKHKATSGFTQKYNINKLIYCQEFNTPEEAIEAEKRIKGWARKKKMQLIGITNPNFKDLLESF